MDALEDSESVEDWMQIYVTRKWITVKTVVQQELFKDGQISHGQITKVFENKIKIIKYLTFCQLHGNHLT